MGINIVFKCILIFSFLVRLGLKQILEKIIIRLLLKKNLQNLDSLEKIFLFCFS